MKQVIVNIPDNKLNLFMEMVKSMNFVKKVESKDLSDTNSKQEFLSELKEAVDEVNFIKAGKKQGVPLNDFLNGL